MTEKKMRQDILEELLRGSQFDNIPGLEGLNDLVRRCAYPDGLSDGNKKLKAVQLHAKKITKKIKAGSGQSKTHRKTTHYLSSTIFETLDLTTERIKDLVSESFEGRISKSRIVNHALQLILNDFNKRGVDSALVKQLLEKKKSKSEQTSK